VIEQEQAVLAGDPTLAVFQTLFGGMSKVLVVAGAGNDSDRRAGRAWGPRLPAANEGILGVSSVTRQLAPSSYSNVSDLENPALDDGVSAFGGEVEVDSNNLGVTVDGLVGLYISDYPPPSSTRNTSGLALWTGTSFSTPIVAGLAACLWGARPGASAADIIRLITRPDRPVVNLMQI
jgi:subtilisin family serine protease